jgi:asparagine synthase (glutamine-hydrolysing)
VSGFAGIIHLDGSPIDRSLLQRLVDFQKFRGPDAQNIWVDGNVGFGHTLLKISPESEREKQPLGLDGDTWIVADCRVDARPELIAQLRSRLSRDLVGVPDVELILYAYNLWGDECVQHLLGDFAFAIWDGPRHRLFCARDQIGVKPFYYARVGSRLVFSNTLECIRQDPAVSGDLNDLAIADFLLFDRIQEPGATSFKDIRRLPPAHTLTVRGENVSTRRYWTLPVSEPMDHSRQSDCVEQFRKLLDTAVADRLRTAAAGVLMSGGLDSTTVAASAQRMFLRNGAVPGLCAYTEVFDRLIPHEERHYAGLVATALCIPIEFSVGDDLGLWTSLVQQGTRWSEPLHSPSSDWGMAQLHQIAKTRRVVLTGYGGDPALSSLLTQHFFQLIKGRRFARALRDAARYFASEGRFSRLYLRTRWRRWFPSRSSLNTYPKWLNPDLEKRLNLREHWAVLTQMSTPKGAIRPGAWDAIASPIWPAWFESFDPGQTRIPVEVRHPFFDLRLLSFLLALPAVPWCSDKELLREAAREVLPDAVRLRRKSPLIADPLIALLKRPESAWVDSFKPVVGLEQYVQRELVPKVFGETDSWNAWIHLRPLSLNFWLSMKDCSGIELKLSSL